MKQIKGKSIELKTITLEMTNLLFDHYLKEKRELIKGMTDNKTKSNTF